MEMELKGARTPPSSRHVLDVNELLMANELETRG